MVVVDAERPDYLAACYADGGAVGQGAAAPVYSSELGLAIEAPRDGLTLEQLWAVV